MNKTDEMEIKIGVRAFLNVRHAAFERFVAAIANKSPLTTEEAGRVAAYYTKHKIAKFNGTSYNVTHGAFMDDDVLIRAAAAASTAA